MLEQLFSRSLSRYTSSPHAADLDAFATMVAARGLDNRRTERHTRRLLRVLETGALPPNATIGADVLRAAFGAWPHKGYVGTYRLCCRYLQERRGRGIEALDLVDLDVSAVEDFLRHLEVDRHNGIATRNVRLAAIHTLARFLAGRHADRLGTWQAIIALPFKRGAQQRPPEYLAAEGVKALLDAIDRGSASGERDFALLALMFNTGARVQEVLDLRLQDVRLDPPQQVRLGDTRRMVVHQDQRRCVAR